MTYDINNIWIWVSRESSGNESITKYPFKHTYEHINVVAGKNLPYDIYFKLCHISAMTYDV